VASGEVRENKILILLWETIIGKGKKSVTICGFTLAVAMNESAPVMGLGITAIS